MSQALQDGPLPSKNASAGWRDDPIGQAFGFRNFPEERAKPTHTPRASPPSLSYPPPPLPLPHPIHTMVSTKAEAEALTIEELTTELKSRGLPSEGLKVSHAPTSALDFVFCANGVAPFSVSNKAQHVPAEQQRNNTPTRTRVIGAEMSRRLMGSIVFVGAGERAWIHVPPSLSFPLPSLAASFCIRKITKSSGGEF